MQNHYRDDGLSLKQKIMILWLSNSALDSRVIGWTFYDGSGEKRHMAGDQDQPPYSSGLAALQDGWRLVQISPLLPHASGDEFRLGYLKYEFMFERMTANA
ncbi:MAG: hypothetical protein KDI36_05390 [Pseudomonadales bacterium]|nr:hypothetical protein [Pseudomonadales bacterium]